MDTVNVNRTVTNRFYRYKIPRVIAQVEGSGYRKKTIIVNMAELTKAIGRPVTYLIKYLNYELGSQIQFNSINKRFLVNGSHDTAKLQNLLDGFIRKFVLCSRCGNPETELFVSPIKNIISLECKACTFYGPLDVNHKVNTFILKNPPNFSLSAPDSSLAEAKSNKRSKKRADKANISSAADQANNSNPGDGAQSTDNITDVAKPVEDNDCTTWLTDVSEEAVRARMQDLTDKAKSLIVSNNNEKTKKERINILFEYIKMKRDNDELKNFQTHKELYTEANRLDVLQKVPLILAELLFSANIIQEVRKHRKLLFYFTQNNLKAQRYLLGGLELIIANHSSELLEKVARILKKFYVNDILGKKSILKWSSKISTTYVSEQIAIEIHEKAKPFLQWLQDDDKKDLSDSDDEVKGGQLRKEPFAPTKIEVKKVEDHQGKTDVDEI